MKTIFLFILTLTTILTGCDSSNHQTYQGYVEGQNIYLASPYSGTLVDAFVKRGQRVKKGDLLFKLDDNPQKITIAEAEAAKEQSKQLYNDLKQPKRPEELEAIKAQIGQVGAQVALAALRVKRNQTLYEKHVLDKDALDASLGRYQELEFLKKQFEANLKLAKLGARVDKVKAQQSQIMLFTSKMKQAEWQLAQKSFFAPADGVIFDTYFIKGEFVDSSRPVAALLTPENIRIEFFVSDTALAALHVGKIIKFDCDGCTKNNQAVIQYVSPEAEYVPPLVYSRENKDKLVFRVMAGICNAANFKPGQPVIVTVSDDE